MSIFVLNVTPEHRKVNSFLGEDVMRIAGRMRHVQIENIDACDLLERTADIRQAMIYCDPPYPSSWIGHYSEQIDLQRLSELLRAQKGSVAVSGFDTEWEHLGWRCETTRHFTTVFDTSLGTNRGKARVDRLWMNYDPPQEGLFK